jgi:hypothetical protein
MRIKILKDKWCGIRKLVKNREIRLSSQIWYIRNTFSILQIQDKKWNTSSMNTLGERQSTKYKGGMIYGSKRKRT